MWAVHGPLGVLDVHGAWHPWRQTAGGGRHGQGLAPGQCPCETWSTTEPAATASCAASLSKPEGRLWSPPGSPGPLVGRWLPCPGSPAGLGTQEQRSGCLWMLVGLPSVLGPLETATILSGVRCVVLVLSFRGRVHVRIHCWLLTCPRCWGRKTNERSFCKECMFLQV